jgi:hypothetical protein
MKPAFTTLTLSADRKKVTVGGPIELNAKDVSAYFWVRVSQAEDADGVAAVDAVGTGDMERDAIVTAVAGVDTSLTSVVASAVEAATGPSQSPPADIPEQIREVTAMWGPVECEAEKEFDEDEDVRVEAWALVKSRQPKRMFHVYWEDAAAQLTVEPQQAP